MLAIGFVRLGAIGLVRLGRDFERAKVENEAEETEDAIRLVQGFLPFFYFSWLSDCTLFDPLKNERIRIIVFYRKLVIFERGSVRQVKTIR